MEAAPDIDAYLADVPEAHREVLQRLRAQIREAVPEAVETISYKIPTFKYRRRALLYFASHKDHCSLYPVPDAMLEAGGDEIATRATGKSTVRFKPGEPLPARIVSKIAKAAHASGGRRRLRCRRCKSRVQMDRGPSAFSSPSSPFSTTSSWRQW